MRIGVAAFIFVISLFIFTSFSLFVYAQCGDSSSMVWTPQPWQKAIQDYLDGKISADIATAALMTNAYAGAIGRPDDAPAYTCQTGCDLTQPGTSEEITREPVTDREVAQRIALEYYRRTGKAVSITITQCSGGECREFEVQCIGCGTSGGGGGGGSISTPTPVDPCVGVTCPSDSICISGSCVKALSVSISPKTISVYANEEVTFTVTVKNELTFDHSITINAPEYYNNTTDTMVRKTEWDDSTFSYTRAGMHMMDRSDSFSASESKGYTLRIRTPSVNTTSKIIVNVSATGSRAEDSAEMNVNADYPRWGQLHLLWHIRLLQHVLEC